MLVVKSASQLDFAWIQHERATARAGGRPTASFLVTAPFSQQSTIFLFITKVFLGYDNTNAKTLTFRNSSLENSTRNVQVTAAHRKAFDAVVAGTRPMRMHRLNSAAANLE